MVWADTVQTLIPTAKTIEASLVAFLWADEIDDFSTISKSPRSILSRSAMTSRSEITTNSKSPSTSTAPTTPSIFGDKHQVQDGLERMPDQLPVPDSEKVDTDVDLEDPYKAEIIANRKARPISLIAPFVSGLGVFLAVILISLGIRTSQPASSGVNNDI